MLIKNFVGAQFPFPFFFLPSPSSFSFFLYFHIFSRPGAHIATTAEKLRGTKPGLGPNTGALAPHARSKAGLDVGCGRGSPPPAVRVWEYSPQKIFENSDAKYCILVTTCCEISCFLKTTAKKLGDQYIVGPQPKTYAPGHAKEYGEALKFFRGSGRSLAAKRHLVNLG